MQTERREAFGEVLADALRRHAPLVIVVAARIDRDRKIPPIEQIASAAAAAQNIMLAAHAQGYGAMWKTGASAYDAGVKQALGLRANDEIIGFLYVGTRVGGVSEAARPLIEDHVSAW